MRQVSYLDALNEALHQEMESDSSVFLMGEDIRGSLRGETKGLFQAFGERIIDGPISEAAMTGFVTGAALSGLRPVLEFQVSSLVYPAFDQLVNQAAKFTYMTGGQRTLPATYIVMASGARNSMAGQHSDNPYPYFLHAGIKTVCPSDPADVKGMMISAIREEDPVALFAPAAALPLRGPVPEDSYAIELGTGETKRDGSDVTVIAVGHLVNDAIAIADELDAEGISVAVWDPRSLLPLDHEGLAKAVNATGRAVVFDDSNRTCGFAAELTSVIVERCWNNLMAPVIRITRADVPIPFSPALESVPLPNQQSLARAIRSVVQESGRPPARV